MRAAAGLSHWLNPATTTAPSRKRTPVNANGPMVARLKRCATKEPPQSSAASSISRSARTEWVFKGWIGAAGTYCNNDSLLSRGGYGPLEFSSSARSPMLFDPLNSGRLQHGLSAVDGHVAAHRDVADDAQSRRRCQYTQCADGAVLRPARGCRTHHHGGHLAFAQRPGVSAHPGAVQRGTGAWLESGHAGGARARQQDLPAACTRDASRRSPTCLPGGRS